MYDAVLLFLLSILCIIIFGDIIKLLMIVIIMTIDYYLLITTYFCNDVCSDEYVMLYVKMAQPV